jgi:AraC family transcriptional regulator
MATPLRPVPISMGAQAHREQEYGPFRLTEAQFQPRTELPQHTHERVTFAVMLAGSFDLVIGGRRLACGAGTVFTEPAGDGHSNAVGTGGARVLVAQPDPAAGFPAPCMRLLDRVNHFPSRAIAGVARRLAAELSAPDDISPLECQALALEMLATAARLERSRALRGAPPAWLTRIASLLHDRFRESLSVASLAREAGVHPAHLSRAFRAWYGTSPGAWQRRLRLEWAAQQLTAGAAPLSRVALEAGFTDQAHFTRAFRRHWGMPPGRYRALRRES